jgi:hypothetical protein
MTPDAAAPPVLIDTGNPLLGPCASQLSAGLMQTAAGQTGLMTVRTPSTTLTVEVTREQALGWSRILASLAGQLSDSGLITVAGGVAVTRPVTAGG